MAAETLTKTARFCIQLTSIYLEMVPPTMGWALLQLTIKKPSSNMLSMGQFYLGNFSINFFPLGDSKLYQINNDRYQCTIYLRSRSKYRYRIQIHLLFTIYFWSNFLLLKIYFFVYFGYGFLPQVLQSFLPTSPAIWIHTFCPSRKQKRIWRIIIK